MESTKKTGLQNIRGKVGETTRAIAPQEVGRRRERSMGGQIEGVAGGNLEPCGHKRIRDMAVSEHADGENCNGGRAEDAQALDSVYE